MSLSNKRKSDGSRVYWNCRCKCGNYFVARANDLRNGKIIYCHDCLEQMNDLTGEKFGKLTVIGKDGNKWKCQCDCGEICLRTAYVLKTGKSTSCGCDRNEKIKFGKNIIGMRFGKLVVTNEDIERSTAHRRYVICKCDCGNNVSVRLDSLKSGSIVSCGCYHREKIGSISKNNFKENDVIFKDNIALIKSSTDDTNFIIDIEDYDKVKKYCWHTNNGYAYAPSRGKYKVEQISMARLIMNCIEEEIEVDHINHNKSDNRKTNLRLATTTNNNWNNKRSHGNIQYNEGRNEWDVIIFYKLQKIKLGSYKEKELALEIRDKAEKIFYGEFQYKGEDKCVSLKSD